ncbi:MAG TPA: YfbM family protein [Polyangiaceae bacterium]|nr:YfbM family protein [Polyangiaceae bacterium]
MSLLGHVYLLTDARISELLAEPARVFEVIDGSYNEPGQGFVDLDKAWHCLHFLLTGSAQGGSTPASFLLQGGSPIGEEDLGGFGPARVFRPLEAAAIAEALAPITNEQLLARFDLKKLEKLDVYPGRWSELNLRSEYELGYYFGPFQELKRVTARAKAERLGLIVWIA